MPPLPPSAPARGWTLRKRIAILALVPAALLIALGGLWLRGQIHSAIYQGFAQHLSEESEALAARLHVDDGSHVHEEVGSEGQFGVIYSGW